jgi:hypothetical protein
MVNQENDQLRLFSLNVSGFYNYILHSLDVHLLE